MFKFAKKILNSISSIGDTVQVNSTSGSTTAINGKTYKGGSISIKNNEVWIDGVKQEDIETKGSNPISVVVNVTSGEATIKSSGNIVVNGNANNVITQQGDVDIKGNVSGNCSTSMGDIDVRGSVQGNCSTSMGDVSCSK